MTVRQQRDHILEHTYRLFNHWHGISPKVTYRIVPYPDNVKCHREVFLPDGRRVKKVPTFLLERGIEYGEHGAPYHIHSQVWELEVHHGTRVDST